MKKSRYKEWRLQQRRPRPPMPAWMALFGHALALSFVALVGLAVANLIAWNLHTPQYLTFAPAAGAIGLFHLHTRRRSPWIRLVAVAMGAVLLTGTVGLWSVQSDLALERPHPPH